jgi:hypothetical protein
MQPRAFYKKKTSSEPIKRRRRSLPRILHTRETRFPTGEGGGTSLFRVEIGGKDGVFTNLSVWRLLYTCYGATTITNNLPTPILRRSAGSLKPMVWG